MSAGDKLFAGSIPENYDRYMVPLIFNSYARERQYAGIGKLALQRSPDEV